MKERREHTDKQDQQKLRVKPPHPYAGSREEEYTVQTLRVASERPANRRKIRLWLNKGQREIKRIELATGKKLFD